MWNVLKQQIDVSLDMQVLFTSNHPETPLTDHLTRFVRTHIVIVVDIKYIYRA